MATKKAVKKAVANNHHLTAAHVQLTFNGPR